MSQGCLSGVESEAGDHADPRPAESFVETLGVIACHGVQYEQRLALGARRGLGALHQQLGNAAPACRAVDEELRDLRAVWLVRRQREDHLHRADQVAVGEGGEQQPAPLLDFGGEAFDAVRASSCQNGAM